ncbi:MAG: homogentisate 1,2-dioxygenase [Candidatus Thermochlorobacter aerophilum]|jgi:homogentisate 1,2-dioxygenase|uniref:Homogentisate 1,2-dioxygenase n=1 Tax=Candidatus Thermochlorobacter aerophilus TaxID=1868324 RepID=A0A395M173_9BACT|nr:MAG: homogentisate 1,2-dioxygenase [Candidatus Thermochlorobacter aerophilum]
MFYYRLGQIPAKRHTQFRKPDGSLYAEELISTKGFSGIYSNVYHLSPPTKVQQIGETEWRPLVKWGERELRHHHLRTKAIEPSGDGISARIPILFNNDVTIWVARPKEEMTYFYRNGAADEVVFIHEGEGTLATQLGNIHYKQGDYLVIPRGLTHQFRYTGAQRWFIIEVYSPVQTPKRYRNEFGQLLEHSPYCERDLHPPTELETHDEKGSFEIRVKKGELYARYCYSHHPFDVVGWDGYYYPFAFSIYDFEPITGRIHQPPPVHQVFEANNLVICNFVPRLFDYHPQAIPAPYNHSNIDSDEVLYYVDGNFMSRRGIEVASLTIHPGGIPHGPHPGTVEKSIGAKETHEYAIMIDTFRPLNFTQQAQAFDDATYPMSWSV